jgi:large subunit ribosomal protein L18
MARTKTPYAARLVRHKRLRQTVAGTPERPRLNVFRSANHTYAQVIDDTVGHTLAAAGTFELAAEKLAKTDAAKANGVLKVVFDRGGYQYHGRVKALAEAAREEGLEF